MRDLSSEDESRTRDLAPATEAVADNLPRELYVYELGVQRLYVRDTAESGVEVYKRAGTTRDPEEMACHDGPVLVDGDFRYVTAGEHAGYRLSHPYAGRMGPLDEPVAEPAVLLAEVERRV